MEKTRTITLEEPLTFGGQEVTEVILRRSTVGDEEDAMQRAIQMKRGNNSVTLEMCLLSKLIRIPYDAIRNMHGPDYKKIRDAHNKLSGLVEAETEENPTQTDLTEKAG